MLASVPYDLTTGESVDDLSLSGLGLGYTGIKEGDTNFYFDRTELNAPLGMPGLEAAPFTGDVDLPKWSTVFSCGHQGSGLNRCYKGVVMGVDPGAGGGGLGIVARMEEPNLHGISGGPTMRNGQVVGLNSYYADETLLGISPIRTLGSDIISSPSNAIVNYDSCLKRDASNKQIFVPCSIEFGDSGTIRRVQFHN